MSSYFSFFLLLLLSLNNIFTVADDSQQQSATIYVWPLTAATPSVLAEVSYNPITLQSSLIKYNKPNLATSAGEEDLVRVGFYSAESNQWIGTATGLHNFDDNNLEKTLALTLNDKGKLLQSSFKASVSSNTGRTSNSLRIQLVKPAAAPQPHLNRPVVLNEDGKVSETEPEKTFFQKYWWAILGVTLLALTTGGDGK
ncbi:MAG: hypothetical protein M1834_006707 [Cirrosporium novae-zelandiae]|nr:MAG: hypothetical protein M1834_006707 [Cirrosporium novae-zelandiae]